MSMSDCDWIIYGPDGTVTVDIGRWETYRERRLQELEFNELKKRYEGLEEEIEEQRHHIRDLEEQLKKAQDHLEETLEELRGTKPESLRLFNADENA